MVKGAQKQMVVIKTTDSNVFEEAYFVVRRNVGGESMDMLAEANRIVEGCGIGKKPKAKPDTKLLLFAICSFVAGGSLGATIVGLLAFAG